MKAGIVLRMRVSWALVSLLVLCPRPAAAFIARTPPTLGELCTQATHVYVLRVERVEQVGPEKGAILFKSVEQLKAQGGVVPNGTLAKHIIASDVNYGKVTGPNGAKIILDWAAEGKTAVLFAWAPNPPQKKRGEPAPEMDLGGRPAHVYIDGYWYWALCDGRNNKVWVAINGEPIMLTRYCGSADKLGDAVARILRGEEVVVPAMVGDNKEDLEERRAKIQDLRASLKILNYDEHGNPVEESVYNGKNPAADSKKAIGGRLPSGQPVPSFKQSNGSKPAPNGRKSGDTKPEDKARKPSPNASEERHEGAKKPANPARPARNPIPTAAVDDGNATGFPRQSAKGNLKSQN